MRYVIAGLFILTIVFLAIEQNIVALVALVVVLLGCWSNSELKRDKKKEEPKSEDSGDSNNVYIIQNSQNNIQINNAIINLTIGDDDKKKGTSEKIDLLTEKYEHIRSLLNSSKYQNALERCDKFLSREDSKNHPKYAAVLANKGVALYGLGEGTKASEYFEQSLGIDSNNPIVYVNLALYYFEHKNIKEALNKLDKCDELNPNIVPALNIRAVIYDVACNRTKEAKNLVQKAISLNPNFWDGYANLGLFESKDGNLEKAQEFINEAIKNNPSNGDYHGLFGSILQKKSIDNITKEERTSEIEVCDKSLLDKRINQAILKNAIIEFEKARELGVKDIDILISNLSSAYLWNGQGEKVIELLEEKIKKDNCKIQDYLTYAQAKHHIGEWDTALKYYKIVNDKTPNSATVLNNIGIMYKEKKDFINSIKFIKKAVELEPTCIGFHSNLGRAHFLNGTYQQAINHIEQSLNLGVKDRGLVFAIARSYTHLKMYASAIEYYKELYEKEYYPKTIIKEYAYCLAMIGKNTDAILLYKEAISIENLNIEEWINLAKTQYNAGEYDDAKNTAKKILQMNISEKQKKGVVYIIKTCENRGKPFLKI